MSRLIRHYLTLPKNINPCSGLITSIGYTDIKRKNKTATENLVEFVKV